MTETDPHFQALLRHLDGRRAGWRAAFRRLRDGLRGRLAALRANRDTVTAEPCDVLLIHPSEKSRRLNRKAPLLASLRQRGLVVLETVSDGESRALRERRLRPPPRPVPWPLYISAARAADLLARYRPRVILTERNGWPVSTFLRAFRPAETRVVHVAHGILSDQSDRLRYHDYDYYALFGQSSLDYLRALDHGFGETTAFFAGPYFPLPAPRQRPGDARTLLFLGAGPGEEDSDAYRNACRLAREWLRAHPGWRMKVRLHPRGGGAPWRDLARTDPALDLRPGDESLEQALDGCQAVWCGYTTAIIDCAVARVPVVVLDRSRDYFQCDRHGVPRVATVRELELAMDEVVETPALCSHRMAAFARYHIEHADDPVSSLADRIGALVAGHEPRDGFRIS